MLQTLAVQNYRTLRDFVIPLGPLNLITGANGSGKSNIYKALRLLAETAQKRRHRLTGTRRRFGIHAVGRPGDPVAGDAQW